MGLHAARKQLKELELKEMELQAERELKEERMSRRADEELLRGSVSGNEKTQPPREEHGDLVETGLTPAEVLLRRVEGDVEAIKRVASNSKNLKGTYIKALKEASASILEAAKSMTSRTSTREVRILQDENNRLRVELRFIKKELRDIRREIAAGKEAIVTHPPSVRESTAPSTRAEEERPTRARCDPPISTGGDGCAHVTVRAGAHNQTNK